jgi:hypothetical protein
MHFLYSIYCELAACTCLEHYLLIFRRCSTNNSWYIACVFRLLTVTPQPTDITHAIYQSLLCSVSWRWASSGRNMLIQINWIQKVHLVGFIILVYAQRLLIVFRRNDFLSTLICGWLRGLKTVSLYTYIMLIKMFPPDDDHEGCWKMLRVWCETSYPTLAFC